jgi:hypothetical protein
MRVTFVEKPKSRLSETTRERRAQLARVKLNA